MQEILSLLPQPSQYLGMEENTVAHDPKTLDLHCALAFPDLYEVGMSYLGQKIIYACLNNMPGVGAERVFAPSREAAQVLKEHHVPLATLESDTPLAQTHLLGFSLTHELAFTNILYMLDLAGIPLRQKDRGESLEQWPIIQVGGGCTLCAEPLAPFVDVMAIGEGEVMMPPLAELLIKARKQGWSRSQFLMEARNIPGIYVPSLFDTSSGTVKPLVDDYQVVRRQAVRHMSEAICPPQQVVPFGAVHNRLTLEIARGCTRGCRFCQAGMTTRPSRERSVEEVSQLLDTCLASTGYEEVSFLSLSSGDFSGLKTLFTQVADRCAAEQISLSLPSLRVGSVDSEIMGRMAGIRRTGATLAPEAGSQRLRDVINKGVTEEGLLYHAKQLAAHGWQQVKLYFMIGLPTEEMGDLDAIVDLCVKVRDAARFRDENGIWSGPRLVVTAALSPFVPKTHTPFQWDPQISLDEINLRIRHVRERIRTQKGITVRWHEPAMSYLEGILSRGDRRLADVVESAYKNGAIFSSWAEGFQLQPWLDALAEHGLEPQEFTGPRSHEGPLPWDHLEAGLSRSFLLKEYERSLRGAISDDCRYSACRQCGTCDTKSSPSLLRSNTQEAPLGNSLNFTQRDQRDDSPIPAYVKTGKKTAPPQLDPSLAYKAGRYRVWHKKDGKAAYISQLELQSLLERSMRRANVPLAFSQGFHPLPLLSFGRALPVGLPSLCEWFNITLRRPLSPQELQERLGPYLLPGLDLLRVESLPINGKVPNPVEELFSLHCQGIEPAIIQAAWEKFARHSTFPLTRVTKKNENKTQDIRPILKSVENSPLGVRLIFNWEELYLSPMTLVKCVLPQVPAHHINLVKLAQIF